jgi:hypothetical protein
MSTLAILLAWGAGWPWVRAFGVSRGWRPRWIAAVVEVLLAIPAGLGLTGLTFFLLLWAGLEPRTAALAGDAVVLAGGAAAWWFFRRETADPVVTGVPEYKLAWVGAAAFAMAALLLAGALHGAADTNPQGNWDAWAVWNLRAKFLAAPGEWRGAVSPEIARMHPEYPPLWPAVVARAWSHGGDPGAPAAPVWAGSLCAVALPLLLAGALAGLRSQAIGWMAGCVLLTTTPFWVQAAGQYADMPLALMVLGSMVAAVASARQGWAPGPLALSGLLAGLGAFTKNEGAVFAAAGLVTAIAVARARSWAWVAGALPGAVAAILFRAMLAPATGDFDAALISGARLSNLLGLIPGMLWAMGSFPAHPLLLAAVLAVLLKFRKPAEPLWALAPPAGLLAGGLLLVLGTKVDPVWPAAAFMDRVLLQALPALLFGFGLLLRAPENAAVVVEPVRKRKK